MILLKLVKRIPHKRKLLLLLKFGITVSLLSYLYFSVNKHQSILYSIAKADLFYISLAILCIIPNLLLQIFKWYLLLKSAETTISFWNASGSILGGFSLGILTPGRIGELAKGLFLSNLDNWKLAGFALIDRLISMLSIIITGIFGLLYFMNRFFDVPLVILLPIPFALILLMFFVYFIVSQPEWLEKKLVSFRFFSKYHNQFHQFMAAFSYLNRSLFKKVTLIALLFQGIVALQFFFLISAFAQNPFFLESLSASFSIFFTKAFLPFSIADLGVREITADYFFNFFIFNRAAIFNASISLFIINVLFPAILGLFMLPKLNFFKD